MPSAPRTRTHVHLLFLLKQAKSLLLGKFGPAARQCPGSQGARRM